MSKTLDLLNNITTTHSNANKSSLVLDSDKIESLQTKRQAVKESGDLVAENENTTSKHSKVSMPIITRLVFNALFLLVLVFNFKLFWTVKDFTTKVNNAFIKLSKIEKLIGENNKQFIVDLRTINSRLKEANAETMQLLKDYDAQTVAIGNLRKAKDVLFRRVNYLDVELDVEMDKLDTLTSKFENAKANANTAVIPGGGE
jgi:hypothetical protein